MSPNPIYCISAHSNPNAKKVMTNLSTMPRQNSMRPTSWWITERGNSSQELEIDRSKVQVAWAETIFRFGTMDSKTKQSVYHSAPFHAAGTAMMSFQPINAIHQHLCKHVSADFHQCVIYDSDDPNAKLIGIEYLVSEKLFDSLPEDEKKYWHSHKYEVESGVLQLQSKDAVPGAATDVAEQPAMIELQKTYGKTIHTWAVDVHPHLPLGPPSLMMAYTDDGQIDQQKLRDRDEKYGMDTQKKRDLRKQYLPPYEKKLSADAWERSGKGIAFEVIAGDLD